jgi:hypothetical protein
MAEVSIHGMVGKSVTLPAADLEPSSEDLVARTDKIRRTGTLVEYGTGYALRASDIYGSPDSVQLIRNVGNIRLASGGRRRKTRKSRRHGRKTRRYRK